MISRTMSLNTNILRFTTNALRFTAASVALAVPALAAPPEKLLLPQATRAVTRTRGEMIPIPTRADGLGIVVDASWLSDHEILHAVRGVLCRYDIISHVNTALPALQHQLAASAPFSVTFAASPDSQWVRWDQANVNPTFCAASVDGSKCVHWPADGEVGQSFWCVDSRHWLRFRFGELTPRTPFHLPLVHARLEDINHPQSTVAFAVPSGLRDLEVLAAVSEHEVVARTPDPVLPYQAPKHPRLPPKVQKKATAEDSSVLTATSSITFTLRATQEISVWGPSRLDASASLHGDFAQHCFSGCRVSAGRPSGLAAERVEE